MLTRLRIALCVLLVLLQSVGLFTAQIAAGQTRRGSTSRAQGSDVKTGLQLRLSEGTAVTENQPVASAAPAARLSEDDAQRVLKRLQPLKAEPSDEQDFALRDRSLPPPRTGRTITDSFPPPATPDAPENVATGPLEVLRYSPEGDVPLVPQLSVTFSQPMVAVTSHQDTLARVMPIKLTPQPPGHWRWVGTKTLLFETEGHFPMATEYTAEIPAGTKSATGAILAAPKRWKFRTPPPVVKSSYPNDGPTTRDPLMFVEFDQRISPASVVEMIRVRSGNHDWKPRLATSEEVAADETVSRLVARATKDRWLAFRVVDSGNITSAAPLPAGSSINVTIGPGTPSLEGPLKTAAAQSFAFRTYGPLRVTEHSCGYRGECSPFDQWSIQFTNPIDSSGFEQSQVRVEEISAAGKKSQPVGLKSAIYGNTLNITGIKRGRTSYRVTIDPAMRDQFGQTLGQISPIVFNVSSAPAALAGPDKPFVVLDPAAPPRLSVYSINQSSLKVRLYRASPEHWGAFLEYLRVRDDERVRETTLPGRLALSKTIKVNALPDEMAETRIDLSPVLEAGFGQAVIVVEPAVPSKTRSENRPVIAWVQATQIGLDAFVDAYELIGWATSLKDGRPLDGVEMSLIGLGAQASSLFSDIKRTTGSDGLAHLTLKSALDLTPAQRNMFAPARVLVARKGGDVAILPENKYWWNDGGGWVKKAPGYSLRWFVFDDRKMYRPGEEVHVKGWIRRVGDGKGGDVGLLDGIATSVAYVVKDSRDNEVLKGEARINALGGFDTAFKLPPTMNLGYAHIQLDAHGDGLAARNPESHDFQVQEFRRPEFEVTAQASEGPHFVGGSATATVNAAYYAGGGLANSEVGWLVTTSSAHFTPPNRDDFTFGKWIPWWIERSTYGQTKVETFNGRTDAAGKHTLRMDFVAVDPPQPSTVTAQASVTDVNRQAWSASANLLVHPADLYVGIRSPRTFVQKGEPLTVQTIVADLDGKLIPGREIKIRAVLMDWVFEKGEWKQQEKNPQECTVRSAEAIQTLPPSHTRDPESVSCRFETREGGQYRVTATIQDDRERKNESELTLWVAGGKVVPKRDVEQEDAQMIPDRKDYRAGDTAEILVQAPFYPAEGVLTLRRSGIVSTERFKMDGPSHTLRIPIEEGYTPNLHVQVDLVGAAVRSDNEGALAEKLPKRPAFAKGELNLQVPPLARKLAVEAKERDKTLEPGGETTVDVEVRDAAGKPVAGSEL
ncbi:MAG TPA: Ig-like domain-containing protein, partial [Blastocatellia bacterium]|nr:Ig-like domain-containing protein [Blastocatellia bacterium]